MSNNDDLRAVLALVKRLEKSMNRGDAYAALEPDAIRFAQQGPDGLGIPVPVSTASLDRDAKVRAHMAATGETNYAKAFDALFRR